MSKKLSSDLSLSLGLELSKCIQFPFVKVAFWHQPRPKCAKHFLLKLFPACKTLFIWRKLLHVPIQQHKCYFIKYLVEPKSWCGDACVPSLVREFSIIDYQGPDIFDYQDPDISSSKDLKSVICWHLLLSNPILDQSWPWFSFQQISISLFSPLKIDTLMFCMCLLLCFF